MEDGSAWSETHGGPGEWATGGVEMSPMMRLLHV